MNIDIIYACLGVFFGELYGSFVGGGSIVTQIVLQDVVGFDIQKSIALDNAAVLGSALGLLAMLLYQGHRPEKWMWYMIFVSTLGALFGANLLSVLDPSVVKVVFTLAVVGLVVKNLFFHQDFDETQDKQEQKEPMTHLRKRVPNIGKFGIKISGEKFFHLSIAMIFITCYNAFLSIGNFAVAMLILTSLFHFKYHKALFIFAFVTAFPRFVSTIEYFRLGMIEMDFYIPMFFSTLIAGALAGYIVEKIDNKSLNVFLKYLTLAMAGYLVYGLF